MQQRWREKNKGGTGERRYVKVWMRVKWQRWDENGRKIVDGEEMAWENEKGKGYKMKEKILRGEEEGSGEERK